MKLKEFRKTVWTIFQERSPSILDLSTTNIGLESIQNTKIGNTIYDGKMFDFVGFEAKSFDSFIDSYVIVFCALQNTMRA